MDNKDEKLPTYASEQDDYIASIGCLGIITILCFVAALFAAIFQIFTR